MSSMALLMGENHILHCEQREGLFRTNICNGKHETKTISSAHQHNYSVGCRVVWQCLYSATSQEKEGFHNTKQCFVIPTVSSTVLFCGKVITRKFTVFLRMLQC